MVNADDEGGQEELEDDDEAAILTMSGAIITCTFSKHQIWLSFSFVEPPHKWNYLPRYWPVPGHRNLGVSTLLSRGSADVAAASNRD